MLGMDTSASSGNGGGMHPRKGRVSHRNRKNRDMGPMRGRATAAPIPESPVASGGTSGPRSLRGVEGCEGVVHSGRTRV